MIQHNNGIQRTGRPTKYSPELAERICEHIAAGLTVKEVAALGGMPAACTMYRWRWQHPEFRDVLERARDERVDAWEEQIVDIADAITWEDPKEAMARVRQAELKTGVRRWLMSKRRPERYGERQQLQMTGAGSVPVKVVEMDVPAMIQRARELNLLDRMPPGIIERAQRQGLLPPGAIETS